MFWATRKTTEIDFRYENVSIHPTAEIGADVEIGPFTFVGANCRIGDGCCLHNNVTIVSNTVLGRNNEVFPSAVIGAVPQDKKYRGEESWVVVGNSNTIRECVTIHGGTKQGQGVTRIGHRNLLMAGCHVAHDCVLEDDIMLTNQVLLGGHVHVERLAKLGGMAAVHHYVTVGTHSFVAGTARVNQDVPPYMLWQDSRVLTVNKVGLKRSGFPPETIQALRRAYKIIYRSRSPRRDAIRQLEKELGGVEEVRILIQALRLTEKGQQGRARQSYNVSL